MISPQRTVIVSEIGEKERSRDEKRGQSYNLCIVIGISLHDTGHVVAAAVHAHVTAIQSLLITIGRKGKLSHHQSDIATMEGSESIYNQDDAAGFIKLNALRLRVKAMVEKQAKKKA